MTYTEREEIMSRDVIKYVIEKRGDKPRINQRGKLHTQDYCEFYKIARFEEKEMRIDKFMNELSKMVFEHGNTCKVMTVIAKKSAEQKRESNLHPIMAQALAPFVKGLAK